MTVDKRKLYIISGSILAALLVTLFAPMGIGRIIAAVLLIPTAVITCLLIKKRQALSMNAKQVLLLMSTIGLLYVVLYYLSALIFGFTRTGYGLKTDVILGLTLPIAAIIVCTEIIRHVLCVQKDKIATAFAYLISLCSDLVICATIPALTNMATFMDMVGMTLFPGLMANLLFNYLSARYGCLPNIVYKAFTVWIFYLIPYGSAISFSLLGFVDLMLPIVIFIFIDSLYEKKRRYALGNVSRTRRILSNVLSIVCVVIMLGSVMLISNQFHYGAYVIATPSMTGELNKGDAAIYEKLGDSPVIEGQVIVFEQNDTVIVHRVVDIQTINGITRYYTKGDANEDLDAGYILRSDIIGLVSYKIPYIGYPTIWIRSLFK